MWLLENNILSLMERAVETGVTPTADQQSNFEARGGGMSDDGEPRILTVAGNSAEITISGVLTAKPDFLAWLFGGGNTTYSEIVTAIASAEQNPAVENITYAISSPGGSLDGLFDAIAAIESAEKPSKAIITDVGASAAFALATQADEVVASNHAARIGSVGIAFSTTLNENEIIITSDAAPKKRPDVTTAEGIAVVKEELNALHTIFVDAIASGRGTTAEKVNTDFGQGATLLAEEAVTRGMIDAVIGVPSLTIVDNAQPQSASSGTDEPESMMDLQTLMAQHPDLYKAVVAGERDRVVAHLTMGEASGDMKTAAAAIRNGDDMTMTLQAQYLTAGTNRANLTSQADDDAVAAAALAAAAAPEAPEADADQVASAVEANFGVTA